MWPTTARDGHPEKRAARKALPLKTASTKYVAMTLGSKRYVSYHAVLSTPVHIRSSCKVRLACLDRGNNKNHPNVHHLEFKGRHLLE